MPANPPELIGFIPAPGCPETNKAKSTWVAGHPRNLALAIDFRICTNLPMLQDLGVVTRACRAGSSLVCVFRTCRYCVATPDILPLICIDVLPPMVFL